MHISKHWHCCIAVRNGECVHWMGTEKRARIQIVFGEGKWILNRVKKLCYVLTSGILSSGCVVETAWTFGCRNCARLAASFCACFCVWDRETSTKKFNRLSDYQEDPWLVYRTLESVTVFVRFQHWTLPDKSNPIPLGTNCIFAYKLGIRSVCDIWSSQIYFGFFEGCFTVHLPHEIIWNTSLIQLGNFINIILSRHVSGTYAHHQEH